MDTKAKPKKINAKRASRKTVPKKSNPRAKTTKPDAKPTTSKATSQKKKPIKKMDGAPMPDGLNKDGKFRKGNNCAAGQRRQRICASDIIDIASDHLKHEYAGTKAEAAFKYGFSPIKELMRMYAEECKKARPNWDKKYSILRAMLPYVYPTMKSVDFEVDGDLPTLKFVLASDDNKKEQGKNGSTISKQAE